VIGIGGTRGKTTVARLLAALIRLSGKQIGWASSDGSFVGLRRVDKADGANWEGGHRTLINPAIEVALIETDAKSIVDEGLPYDRSQIAVITNIDPEAKIPDRDVTTPEQMVTVLRTLVDVVLREGVAVLNADDARVAELAPLCDGEVIFFGTQAHNPVIAGHLAQGRRAVFFRHGELILASGDQETPLPTGACDQPFEAANIAAAAAGAWALGIAPDLIRAGIETQQAGLDLRPGRQ
jgi:cyanophycin synthetase